jgi:sugar lactone lactonase YvrE
MRYGSTVVVTTFAVLTSGFLSRQALAQSLDISTLAGSTSGGGYADDIGLNARFSAPTGLAIDQSGTIYIADSGNHVIRKITPDGTVATVAGKAGEAGSADGIAGSARFNFPYGITIGPNNTLYVSDTYNHTIRSISPAGVVATLAGLAGTSGTADATGSNARFTFPGGIATDTSGNLYIADINNHAIRKIGPGAVVTTLAGSKRSSGNADGFGTQASFQYPYGVTVDASGFVYVADTENHLIRKISAEGRVTTIAGAPPSDENASPGSKDGVGIDARFNYPWGIAVDAIGNVFVADSSNRAIRKITPAAVVTTFAGSAGASGNVDGTGAAARFHFPAAMAISSDGTIIVSDRYTHTVRRVTSAAVVSTLAGSAPQRGTLNGRGTSARFLFPEGVAFDNSGNVLVADSSHTIRKIMPDGAVTTFAGTLGSAGSTDGVGGAARFRSPSSIAVDADDNVYVADTANHTVRKITSSGIVTTFAGVAGASGDSDGSGSQARFDTPFGVATDRFGNIYVADTYNHKIKVIEPAGVVSTFAGSGLPGSRDAIGTSASFNYPTGVALDDQRNIYVADWGNHTIRKITQAGVVTTLAGSAGTSGRVDGTGSSARFVNPNAVAARGDGTVFVADTYNDTIRRITPSGVVTTVAGLAMSRGNVDGRGSTARFFFPDGIALDKSGHFVIADTYNHAIRLGATALAQIISFAATPGSVEKPQLITLSWSTSDASLVTIDNGIGSVSASGSRTVNPTTTTTYTLSAIGDGATVTSKVTVFVGVRRRHAVRH